MNAFILLALNFRENSKYTPEFSQNCGYTKVQHEISNCATSHSLENHLIILFYNNLYIYFNERICDISNNKRCHIISSFYIIEYHDIDLANYLIIA